MGRVAGSRAFSGARTGISVCREYRDQNHPGTRRWIMTTMEAAPMGRHSLSAVLDDIVALPERIPLSLVQLMTRLAIGHVFWTSAQFETGELAGDAAALRHGIPGAGPSAGC